MCVDTCAEAWPLVIVDSAEFPAGLDAAVFTLVDRPGGKRVKYETSPVANAWAGRADREWP